ncbi:heavy-metal-associated domain-containing protein [Winogradskyella litorisediminis]|uniref:Heavy-metal-associated domain-containing protein n=1 Tax=Winogradskyella litorisediminis TaxID=1156618 RepID=A0ABW3N6Y1_9FLAO
MKHTYKVTGMTCNGCKASVKEKLSALQNITSVNVNLEKEEATVEMTSHVSLSELQLALPEKYQISQLEETNVFSSTLTKKETSESKLKQLFPLFLILSYIFVASILLNKTAWNTARFMYDFMGLFFIVFSFFKFLDLKGFSQSFSMYDPLAKRFSPYAKIYPFIELVLGFLFLMRIEIKLALILTLIILAITTIGVAKVLLDKKTIQCACLGTVLKLPMTTATIIENSIMLLMAIYMLVKIFVL